ERTDDRARPAARVDAALRADLTQVLREERNAQRVEPTRDRVSDDDRERDENADPDAGDDHADETVARLDLADALPREEPHRREEQPVPHDEEPETARERRELLVDQPRQAERPDGRSDDVDDVGRLHRARPETIRREVARLLELLEW